MTLIGKAAEEAAFLHCEAAREMEIGIMNKEPKKYGLLAGVGSYDDERQGPLPAAVRDLDLMRSALTSGLKIEADDIRVLGESGSVPAKSFARALSEFGGLLCPEDVFVLYFSGHGTAEGLCFSDRIVDLQSIVDYVECLRAGRKIVILDCCHAGNVQLSGKTELSFEEIVSTFAGKGIAVMASSALDERSWLCERKDVSLYTKILSAAFTSRRNIRKGYISLGDISDQVRTLMQLWNKTCPEHMQHPVFRENYIGDIRFKVEEYHPYVTQKITAETQEYYLHSMKPLSTGHLKRFAAFVILKGSDDSVLPRITKEIVFQFKNSDVYASRRSEQRFKGRSADAIWCYFGHDEEDILRNNHFAYTIWADDEDLRKVYYRDNRNAEVSDGIYVFWNSSYGMVKELQRTDAPEEEIIQEYQELAALLTSKAEAFIKAFEETENRALSVKEMKATFKDWAADVKRLFFKLSDADLAPAERTEWAETILELAGWVTDLALFMDSAERGSALGEHWMVKHAIGRYYQSLEQLREKCAEL